MYIAQACISPLFYHCPSPSKGSLLLYMSSDKWAFPCSSLKMIVRSYPHLVKNSPSFSASSPSLLRLRGKLTLMYLTVFLLSSLPYLRFIVWRGGVFLCIYLQRKCLCVRPTRRRTDEDESRKKCANDFVFAQEASKRVAARDKE